MGASLSRGGALLARHFLLLTGASSLVWLIVTAGQFATIIGALASLILAGPLYGGLAVLTLRLIRGEPASITDIFAGFDSRFVPLMLVMIVTGLLTTVGMLFCVLPGLVLTAVWTFAIPLAADKGTAFWPSLQISWAALWPRLLRIAALLVVAWFPVVLFDLYVAYRTNLWLIDTLGTSGTRGPEQFFEHFREFAVFASRLGIQQQFVVLLNLPFATAVTLYAYEDLFGRRRPSGH